MDFYPNGGFASMPGCDEGVEIDCSHFRAWVRINLSTKLTSLAIFMDKYKHLFHQYTYFSGIFRREHHVFVGVRGLAVRLHRGLRCKHVIYQINQLINGKLIIVWRVRLRSVEQHGRGRRSDQAREVLSQDECPVAVLNVVEKINRLGIDYVHRF